MFIIQTQHTIQSFTQIFFYQQRLFFQKELFNESFFQIIDKLIHF